ATRRADDVVLVWDSATGAKLASVPVPRRASGEPEPWHLLAWSADGRRLLALRYAPPLENSSLIPPAFLHETVSAWDVAAGREVPLREGDRARLRSDGVTLTWPAFAGQPQPGSSLRAFVHGQTLQLWDVARVRPDTVRTAVVTDPPGRQSPDGKWRIVEPG